MTLPGYQNPTGTGIKQEILASEKFTKTSVTIDSTARDTTNGTTTDLRRGLMLVPKAALDGRYIQLAAADAGSPDVVVLAEDIFGIDNGDQLAEAYEHADFKDGVLLDDSGVTLTHFTAANCQRINIMVNK